MFDFTDMINELNTLPERVFIALEGYGKTVAAKLETKAKQDRPWTDRTAHARQSLHGDCYRRDTGIVITLESGVSYAVYLEFAREKKYAVVYPTLKSEVPLVMQGLRRLLERL